jgi:predicted nucleotidyltransferase
LTKDVIFYNKINILKIINQFLLFFSIFQAMKTFKEWGYKSPEASSLLKRVQDKVHSLLPGAEIILYGSRARLEADLESDWDFLILLDEKPDQKTVAVLRDRLYELELESDTEKVEKLATEVPGLFADISPELLAFADFLQEATQER